MAEHDPACAPSELLARAAQGDADSRERLYTLLYDELKRVARRLMDDQRAGHTLQPTALVHEAWLKLAGADAPYAQSQAQFLAFAARAMRNILVDHARARGAHKRGGGLRVTLHEELVEVGGDEGALLLDVHEALERLEHLDAELGRLVELRYFGGLSIGETALALGTSPASVDRGWRMARAWLGTELEGASNP